MVNFSRPTARRIAIALFSSVLYAASSFSHEPLSQSPEKAVRELHLPQDALIFSGGSNLDLATKIAEELKVPLANLQIDRFADGEISIKYGQLLRGKDIFLIQPICTTAFGSVNDHLMELILEVDAAKRASVEDITVVIPYFGYARQDRKTSPCVPISASVVASMIENTGIKRVLCVDLHCGQIQGFFKNIPVDNLYASMVFRDCIRKMSLENIVVVSPDAGGMERAKKFADFLKGSDVAVEGVAMIYKERKQAGVVESCTLLGDVQGKTAIIVDDMCDSGGTLVKASDELKAKGAASVYACISHGVFSGTALKKIQNSSFTKVLVTDSIPLRGKRPTNLEVVSLAPLLAEAISRISNHESVSEMFR